MYTKQNFQIAKIAEKGASRFAIQGIRVTPAETIATDGHRLIRVKSTDEFGTFEPFNMSAVQAIKVAQAAGKDPVGFAPDTHINGHVTAQVGKAVLTDDKPDGRYPDVSQIFPKTDGTWTEVSFNVKYMKELMELHAASGKFARMFFKKGEAIVLETCCEDGPDVQSLLMPLRDDKSPRY